MNTEVATTETLGDDVLRGAAAIAAFIGEPERRTRHLLDRGLVPAGQIGRIWHGSKRKIRAHYERVTDGQGC
jgi:hypothetical protein